MKGIIKHVEFILSGDLTCWGQDIEDFERDTEESTRRELISYLLDDIEEFLDSLEVTRVYYEEVEI